jgi:folate-binding protein YgfZ
MPCGPFRDRLSLHDMTPGYQALRTSAAWFDISDRARLRLSGTDRVRLLHALATNAIEGLEPGQQTETFFLTPQGRIVARCRVYIEAYSLLLESEPASRQRLLDYLDQYIIMDDVTVEDETDSTIAVAIEGPAAESSDLQDIGKTYRSSLTGLPGFWIEADKAREGELRGRLKSAGIEMAEPADWQTVRVENRVPVHGKDYGETNIPHETQLLDLVSFSKGCYVGQEIVERVNSQGQVNRLLTPVEIESSEMPETAELRLGDRVVGTLSSAVLSPRTGKIVGFAVVRREALAPGAEVSVGGKIAHTPPWP